MISVVMPVYNEHDRVRAAIDAVLAVELGDTVDFVIVDDGSTDGTAEILRSMALPESVHVLFHERNKGKGAAVRTGLAEATGEYTTIMDADLEYDPRDILAMLEPLRTGDADAVFGTRGFQAHSAYSFWYVVGNRAVTFFSNFLYNSWISDIMTGQKAMRTELFRSLDLRARGFSIEPEITARLLRKGIRIYEVPIVYRARSREQGKKLTAFDGVRVIATLLRCRIA